MDADPLAELRDVLRAPDQRTWHRRLRARVIPPVEAADPRPALFPALGADNEPGPTRRWAPLLAVPVLAVAIVAVTALRGGTPPPAAAPPLAFDPPTSTASTATTTAAEPDAVRVGPVEAIEVVGREVRRAGGRWEVGADGDVVTVGDWDCDRRPTPAVLRPSTGTVAVFDGWDATVARPVTTVAGAAGLRPGTVCGEAAVVTANGTTQLVDTTPAEAP